MPTTAGSGPPHWRASYDADDGWPDTLEDIRRGHAGLTVWPALLVDPRLLGEAEDALAHDVAHDLV